MSYALVTGASSGIGAAIAVKLLDNGWNVILLARSVDKMEKLTKNYASSKYLIIKCDVLDPNEIKSSCDKVIKYCNNKLQLLVNNVGGSPNVVEQLNNGKTKTIDYTLDKWNEIINLNLTSTFLFIRYLKDSLINNNINNKLNGSSIINIGSVFSEWCALAYEPYCIAKAGLKHLTKLNALKYSEYGIRCNCIEPSLIKTDTLIKNGYTTNMEKIIQQKSANFNPSNRIGTTNDIVNLVIFLENKKLSGFINGQCIQIDGGQSLIPPMPQSKSKL